MADYRIAVIRGDGVGIEVIEEGAQSPDGCCRPARLWMGLHRIPVGLGPLLRARADDA